MYSAETSMLKAVSWLQSYRYVRHTAGRRGLEGKMFQSWIGRVHRHGHSGQSLVETALFLPIIILLLAGMVEVSNLLVTQNRVTTASRVGTGFAAANVQGDEWLNVDPLNGWPAQVAQVARNNVTETLDLDPARWDIYTVKARLNTSGNFDAASGGSWNSYHAWGSQLTFDPAAWSAAETEIQGEIVAALDDTGVVDADGLEIVATVAYHNRESILGLEAFNLGAFTRVRGLTVMRVSQPAPFVGCPLLPIGVRFNQYSMYPSNWTTDPVTRYLYNPDGSPVYPDDPVSDMQIFPDSMDYPSPDLEYENQATAPKLNVSTFLDNVPGVPLSDGQRGYLYRAREGGDTSGGFGWLSWDGDTDANALKDSLSWPGNFMEKYPGGNADMDNIKHHEGEGLGDGDGVLEIGEWLENATGNIHSEAEVINQYIDNEMPVTLIVYDQSDGTGSNAIYRVAGFVKVKLLAYEFGTDIKWIMVEFVGWGEECQ